MADTPPPPPNPPARSFPGIAYFLHHRTIAHLLMLGLVIAGLLAASRMRAQYFPDVVPTEISVSVAWPGAGAEDVDRAIVDRIEPALMRVEAVARVASEAREGQAAFQLEFEPGTDLGDAAAAVETAVAAVADLPDDAEDPVIRQDLWRDRVTDVVITGPVGRDQLARLTEEFAARLYAAGITRTTIQGLAAPDVLIEVPTIALMRHDLTMAEIAEAVSQKVALGPVGELDGGAARLRMGADLRALLDLGAIVLRTGPDGAALRLADIATVTSPGPDEGRATYVGDDPATVIRVDRSAGGDAIEIQAEVARQAAAMTPDLPAGVTIDLVRTRADLIADRLALVIDNGVMGLALVVGLLFLFLNARTALWVAAGVPVAVLAGLAAMYAAGLTLNMVSLFALIITLGIVVDDAIVVAEHADFRARHLGEAPFVAAERAAARMAGPVVASTLTTVIAFFGLVLIGGEFGTLISDIPVTVSVILLASLVECFYILPNHMAHALRGTQKVRWWDWPSTQVNRGLGWFNIHVTRPLVRAAILARYPLVALALFLLANQTALVIRGDVPFRFFNAPEQAVITGSFAMADGASRADTLAMLREVQRAADTVAARLAAEHGQNPIRSALAEIGGTAGRSLAGAADKEPDLLGGIAIELIDPDLRPFSAQAFSTALQDEIVPSPLMEDISFRGARFGPSAQSLAVELYGSSTADLAAGAAAVKAALAAYPAVTGLEDSFAAGKDDLVVNLTPRGQSLGLDAATLARALRDQIGGVEAARLPYGTRSGTVRVAIPAHERTADFLQTMQVRTGAGTYLPLSDVVTVEPRPGLGSVVRENGKRVVTVSGELIEDRPAEAAAAEAALRDTILPRVAADYGLTWAMGGQRAEEEAFLSDALVAFLACLVGIYICLAWISGQWFRPLMVMSVIPFGLIGAVWGHAVWDVPLSLFSIVGLIGMAGIIINDAIVLVSTIDEYAETRALRPAIVEAVADRLRPVFLTTATTVAGLAPLMFERSSQAEFLKPTVITLVYGLSVGFVLVLLLIPALLVIEADIRRRVQALRRSLRGRGHAGVSRAGMRRVTGSVLALYGVTMGPVVVAGGWPEAITRHWPLAASAPELVAFGVFVGAAAIICGAAALRGPRRT